MKDGPVLVQKQHVEPLVLVLWHEHPHAVTPQLKVHPLVLHVPNPVHTKVGAPFAKENRSHCDTSCRSFRVRDWEIDFAHVVEESGHG